ncbi:pyridoxal phosphate-dependent aminotransferase [Planctomycetota bacterium]
MANFCAHKTTLFTKSVFMEMTRLSAQYRAINLAQGFPDFPAPAGIKEAACKAITNNINQYAITWGAANFRQAIAEHTSRFYGVDIDPESQVTVTCGSTEGMFSSMIATLDPGHEVILFEPFYETYIPDAILCGAAPRFVSLYPPEWDFDPDELAAAFNGKTKAIIVNTPANPSGRVFTQKALEYIARLCLEHDVVAITDEIYEHIVYPGGQHVFLYGLPGMADRTISISGLSKTYSVTGWRLGYCIASPELTSAIRKVHDFVTVGAAAPLQAAGAVALRFEDQYYEDLMKMYLSKRDILLEALNEAGFKCFTPQGAYYIMTDISNFGFASDVEFVKHLVTNIGVGAVPGSSFYHRPEKGKQQVRFCFCKKDSTLNTAAHRLLDLKNHG